MCPDECSAELWMVSPVSLESRPLEPLRSDLRPWKPLDGSRALGFLSSSWPFRLLPPVEVPASFSLVCCVSSSCAVPRFEDFDSPCVILSCCVLWTFNDYRFPPGTFVPKIYMTL
ncbi:hypothetical protein NPIL_260741 [Nephila pilipes]|uniref:Uncharacterized protein n=1 Tax=Nephila pilipes TaxID=299642 RepID=A0A8X6QGL4_NEPPI|nr:hypothetical protein NPIL_260741 [Nephila pilipes]